MMELKEQIAYQLTVTPTNVWIVGAGFGAYGIKIDCYCKIEADRVFRKERHKRCMRLVDWCRTQYKYYKCEYDYDEGFGDVWLHWMRWCKKWESRWLAIAAQYEEVSKC